MYCLNVRPPVLHSYWPQHKWRKLYKQYCGSKVISKLIGEIGTETFFSFFQNLFKGVRFGKIGIPIKGTRISHLKICLFGIWIILSKRPLRASRYKKSSKNRSQVFLLQRKFTFIKEISICRAGSMAPILLPGRGGVLTTYPWRRHQLKSA